MSDLLTPKEAAVVLGMSTATITRCVKLGAPVHRWGPTGARYRICASEFVAWMESRGGSQTKDVPQYSTAMAYADTAAMAKARRALMRGGVQ